VTRPRAATSPRTYRRSKDERTRHAPMPLLRLDRPDEVGTPIFGASTGAAETEMSGEIWSDFALLTLIVFTGVVVSYALTRDITP